MESSVKGAFEGVNEQIKESVDSVESVLNSWKESTQVVSQSLKGINDQLGLNSQHLVSSARTLETTADAFKKIPSQVKVAVDPLQKVSGVLAEAMSSVMEISESLSETGTEINGATDKISGALSQLVDTWETQTDQLKDADKELAEAFDTIQQGMRTNMNSLSDFNQQTIDKFAEVIRSLNGLVAEIKDTVEDLADNVNGPR
jgi:ABC-type transporter Mla subunit MlaD